MKNLQLGLVLLFAAGCGPGIDAQMVTGKVTLDNQAIEGAAITFQPVEGGTGKPAIGLTDASGVYAVTDTRDGAVVGSGAVAGEYKVGVLWFKPSANDSSNATGESSGADQGSGEGDSKSARTKVSGPDSLLPAAYQNPKTSGLTVTVVPGENTFNFELDSKFKPKK